MRRLVPLAIAALVLSACGGAQAPVASAPAASAKTSPAAQLVPPGPKLSAEKVQQLAALFDDQPFVGGQRRRREAGECAPARSFPYI